MDKRHAAKNWDTKNANCSVHPFLWETIGRTSLANSKTISFLGFSTSPENTPHQILLSASPKLREAAPTSLLNQCFVLLAGHCTPKKELISVSGRSSVQKISSLSWSFLHTWSGCRSRFRNPKTSGSKQAIRFALVDFRNQEVHP